MDPDQEDAMLGVPMVAVRAQGAGGAPPNSAAEAAGAVMREFVDDGFDEQRAQHEAEGADALIEYLVLLSAVAGREPEAP